MRSASAPMAGGETVACAPRAEARRGRDRGAGTRGSVGDGGARRPFAAALALALLLLAPPARAAAVDSLIPADADWALAAPEAAAGARTAEGLIRATRSPLLRNFRSAYAGALGVDPFDRERLAAAGFDVAAPSAMWARGGAVLLSLGVADEAKALEQARRWLKTLGEVRERNGLLVAERAGAAIAAASHARGRVVLARAERRGVDARRALASSREARALSTRPLARAALSGAAAPLVVWTRSSQGELALGLSLAGGDRLVASGRIRHPRFRNLLAAAGAPAGAPGGELALVHARLSPAALSADGAAGRSLRWLLDRACPRCQVGERAALAKRLGRALAGDVRLLVGRLEPAALRGAGGLAPEALSFAYAADVRDPAAAPALVRALATATGATAAEEGHVLPTGFRFGLVGRRLWVATDASLARRLLASARDGAERAPLEAWVEPRVLAEGLDALTLRDALAGGPLASLFAARLELGSLLRESGALHLSARPAGGDVLALELAWALRR